LRRLERYLTLAAESGVAREREIAARVVTGSTPVIAVSALADGGVERAQPITHRDPSLMIVDESAGSLRRADLRIGYRMDIRTRREAD
jgi:hypothetical protein